LVVTLGPASKGHEAALAEAGATQFRVNASHLSVSGLQKYVEGAVRRAPSVPVVVDLQGAKMRLGDFEPRAVRSADVVTFVLGDTAVGNDLPLPHPEAFHALHPGDPISIDDGRIHGVVIDVAPDRIACELRNDGLLRPRKGFNRADHPLMFDDLVPRDVQLALAAAGVGCRTFALSFVADGRECNWLRRHLGQVRAIAKIERHDALTRLSQIATSADAIWICRGDLGAQLGTLALGPAVAAIDPKQCGVAVSMAGQVLEHLTSHRDPTRSEICHLYDLMARGYAGIVLSDETAIGIDPVNAVRTARTLLDAACT
jgi:pyruvate kinase